MQSLETNIIRYVREFNRIVEEEVKKQKEKQSLSNKAKEGLAKGVGKLINKNKNPEAAPKENILSDEEIAKRAERIAKNELEKDTKLVSSHDQYEKNKKKRIAQHEKLRSAHSSQQLTRAESKIAPIRGRGREVYALH
ncbi:hypothetical protein Hpkin87_10990 [Helicobacter pylori]